MQLSDRRHEPKMADEGPCGLVRTRLRICPIHVLGVEHGARELIEELLTIHRRKRAGIAPSRKTPGEEIPDKFTRPYGPSHGRAGEARVSRPCVRPRSWACRGRPQAPRTSSPSRPGR